MEQRESSERKTLLIKALIIAILLVMAFLSSVIYVYAYPRTTVIIYTYDIDAMGGNPFSAYGLCHLGDYEATVFSKFSHNRAYGEALVKGEHFDKLAEGYYTAKAIVALAEKHGVDMPICRCVYGIIHEGKDAKAEASSLFERSIKTEFYK